MSSQKESPVESVAQLDFRKKPKDLKKKASPDDKQFRRKVRSDHGYPQITLPKFFLQLGLKLNAEVVIERRGRGSNPLNWEIVIKPAKQGPA